MNKIYFLVILCFFSFFANAQTKITLKGKLTDKETAAPIEEATVYITNVKDSAVIDYTISDKNGIFKMETKKITVPFFLKVSATGYENHAIKENSGTVNKDFGVLSILKKEIILNEVVVKSEAPPVRIKKDTLEFNAASFKVRPDANVEALIRQLPGAKNDANGKITINGKVVNKILVDGKPFFNKDGKIALQNLSADMIKKVQVSNTKTKEEEMNKLESSSNNSTINLTLKEDKNKGIFGKFMGGYGTDNRYESSGIVSYFKNKRRISALFSSNNINGTGFSMDDVFDNMGGGRNKVMAPIVPQDYDDSSSAGIIHSTIAGLNYDDEWTKGLDSHTAYNYKKMDNENQNKTAKAEFLPKGNIFTDSESTNEQLNESHNINLEFDYKINNKTRISMVPNLVLSTNRRDYTSHSSSKDDNNQLMNENNATTNSKVNSENFDNWISFNRTFNKKRRYINASLQTYNSRNDSNSINNSATLFYQGTTPDDIRNQNVLLKRANDNFSTYLNYSEPITDSLSITIGMITKFKTTKEDNTTFDFDTSTGKYSDRNEQMSNYFDSKTTQFAPSAGLKIRKKKLSMNAFMATYAIEMDNHSNYLNANTDLPKSYIFPEINFMMNYNFSQSSNIYAIYYHMFDLPTASQLLPVENLSNPLNTFIGNSNLDIAKYHQAYFSFVNNNTSGLSGFSINSSLIYKDSDIAATSIYDDNGKQKTTYVNVSGNYDASLRVNWNKTVKKDLHSLKYELSAETQYQFQKGYTNAELYSAKIKSISPTASISYDYGDFFTLRPSYNFTYRKTNYDNYRIDETSNREHNFKIEATNYIHKQWVFGNDFGYNYNSNISGGFKKDFYLLNTSLSYKSKEDQWIFKFKVYDILNQNQSATRSITATSIVDAQNTVLKRYGMLSLTYKFKKFGKKLEELKEDTKK